MEINIIQFIGDVDTHYTNASSYVIIPKPHFSSREGIHSRCRRFGSIIHRYDRCCRSRWRWRSIDRSTVTGAYSTVRHSVFAVDFGCFSRIKNCRAELRREIVRESAFSRYEQCDTSPETIEQDLRTAVC